MRFELLDPQMLPATTFTIRRISNLGTRWRVLVEAHRSVGGWAGRFVFEPERSGTRHEARYGPLTLRGRSYAEILDEAHGLPDRRIHELLLSLG